MKIAQEIFDVDTNKQGLYEITNGVIEIANRAAIETGMLTLFCQHTSCSLIIQENADPDVQRDLDGFFARLVPEGMDWLTHTMEGPDDMPAHIKSALTATSQNIPIVDGQLALGTWQGIYLFEHRHAPHRRHLVAHIIGT